MPLWQDKLFIFLMRNAANPTDFFQIPPGRVVELGTQVVGVSGGTPKGKNSGARGRRMADKARGPRREPMVRTAEPRRRRRHRRRGAASPPGVLLNAALERRGGLDEAMALPEVKSLPGPDRAFARAVAMAALRRLGEIDQILDRKLQKAPPRGGADHPARVAGPDAGAGDARLRRRVDGGETGRARRQDPALQEPRSTPSCAASNAKGRA